MTVLVALGTHARDERGRAGPPPRLPGGCSRHYPGLTVVNHEWWDPDTFVSLGTIAAERIAELSGGLLDQAVDVRLNRAVVEHDVALIVGPVFPHEVVGFSGGNKYFFPGVAGQEVIDLSHWLGRADHQRRDHRHPRHHPGPRADRRGRRADPGRAAGACRGRAVRQPGPCTRSPSGPRSRPGRRPPTSSAQTHVRYLDAPVRRVLSMIPSMYDDIWTAAKGFYKVEPVVADGGQVILYAPHMTRDLRRCTRRSARSATTAGTTS